MGFFSSFFLSFFLGGRGGHFKKVAEQVGKEMWLNVFDQWELTRIQKVELWPQCSSCCRELITTSYCLSMCGLNVFNQVPWMNVCLRYALAGLLYVPAQDVLLENVLVNGQNRGVSHPCHLPAPARNPSGQTSTDKSSCWLPPPPDPPCSPPPFLFLKLQLAGSRQLLRFGGWLHFRAAKVDIVIGTRKHWF